MDLHRHFSVTTADQVSKILAPLAQSFGIKHFRYLKLYADKSRILLSNLPDCTRFMYEEGHYKDMWFDGEFPDHLTEGCHYWDVIRLTGNRTTQKTECEKEINQVLGLYHGITYVYPGINYWEIYTFDSDDPAIYHMDKKILMHFILYFKEKAARLIDQGEREKIVFIQESMIEINKHPDQEKFVEFFKKTRLNRYYLSGKYHGIYLTSKEMQCIYWLVQGKTAGEIAIIEGNSIKTIHQHLENIRKKLNCYKQTQLVRIVLESGILHSAYLTNVTV